ncbi:nuclear transport factor 2 family protein [Carboxylicivirga sediminis]|uniref:Nuclear transport factor 2 family protein n=1 Tax=Carboxylicivirga sediminis TaxID=2006564 RepID=A0A941IW33_9BACT|nr:nuclear transport factor 2 family protein [Carboxylicivirga sediminis]MBR8534089.1 nuclear transport factor 2 family protein [Carboxylicivirga sediminis]
MKKYILLVATTLLAFTSFAQSDKEEVKAIKQVIQTAYLDGTQNIGDMDKIDAGFHPDFRMQVLEEDGSLSNVDRQGWKQMAKDNLEKGILPRPEGKQVSVNILNIDIEKYAASVKMEYILEGKTIYIDYLQLYKFSDGWKIVNKIYYTVGQ